MDTAEATELHRTPFPTDPEAFDQDDRISFSKLSNTHILETEDGREFEYDAQLKRWVAVVRIYPPLAASRLGGSQWAGAQA
jgi:HIV Tat-specific factor 1